MEDKRSARFTNYDLPGSLRLTEFMSKEQGLGPQIFRGRQQLALQEYSVHEGVLDQPSPKTVMEPNLGRGLVYKAVRIQSLVEGRESSTPRAIRYLSLFPVSSEEDREVVSSHWRCTPEHKSIVSITSCAKPKEPAS